MKVTKSTLNRMNRHIYNGHHWVPANYVVLSEEKAVKTITSKIPFETGFNSGIDENLHTKFPAYLHGFEEYYDNSTGCFGQFRLKKEYWDKNSRPSYTIDISYILYDIELTDDGKELVNKRYEQHKRLMELYAKMMG